MYQLKQYINFLLKSTNQHGVHSPFVFDLVTKCFYDKTGYSEYELLENYRNKLLKNDRVMHVQDLGPGSRKTKSNNRKVKELAKTSGSSLKRAKLLLRLSRYLESESILELGSSLGIGTQALSLGNPDAQITTIEGCPNIFKFTKANLQSNQHIRFINGDFSEEIANIQESTFDFIFFDGNHKKEATLEYFEMLLPKAHNDSVFILDDIYWSEGMTEAWKIIKEHPKITVTIDTFQWGFVFFRQEQAKEHFVVRV